MRRKYEPKIQKSGSEFHGFYFARVTPTLEKKQCKFRSDYQAHTKSYEQLSRSVPTKVNGDLKEAEGWGKEEEFEYKWEKQGNLRGE